MANSLTRATAQPPGSFAHGYSGSKWTISGMSQRLERNGITTQHRVDYVIGSGNHAFGYVVQAGAYLFQSPLSYYTARRMWDMAPGYEQNRNADFNRPVTAECLLCHSGHPRPVPETVNRYESPPFAAEAISCDRCHGPVEVHLRRPSADNIVNPRKLPPRARDSVCEQCHLGGEARILNPGRQFADFQPGQELEDIWTTYIPDAGAFKVVSHVQQLALSACARKSNGRMWCGSCHDPHEKPGNAKQYYRTRCLNCHGEKLLQSHAEPSDDCAGCHMQRRPAKDGGHTAFTDHQIPRHSQPNREPPPPQKLIAWREPAAALAKRNLGLACIAVGRRDQSVRHMEDGFRLLLDCPKDPAVLEALGLVHLGRGEASEAAQIFEQALQLRPEFAPYYLNAALAWKQAGGTEKAAAQLERAIELDRSFEEAYFRLAALYSEAKNPAKARQALERYLKFMPDSIAARTALR